MKKLICFIVHSKKLFCFIACCLLFIIFMSSFKDNVRSDGGGSVTVQTITVNHCRYIVVSGYFSNQGGCSIIHAANCPNHRNSDAILK